MVQCVLQTFKAHSRMGNCPIENAVQSDKFFTVVSLLNLVLILL